MLYFDVKHGHEKSVRVKKSSFKTKPEFDDVAAPARKHKKSFREIKLRAL